MNRPSTIQPVKKYVVTIDLVSISDGGSIGRESRSRHVHAYSPFQTLFSVNMDRYTQLQYLLSFGATARLYVIHANTCSDLTFTVVRKWIWKSSLEAGVPVSPPLAAQVMLFVRYLRLCPGLNPFLRLLILPVCHSSLNYKLYINAYESFHNGSTIQLWSHSVSFGWTSTTYGAWRRVGRTIANDRHAPI